MKIRAYLSGDEYTEDLKLVFPYTSLKTDKNFKFDTELYTECRKELNVPIKFDYVSLLNDEGQLLYDLHFTTFSINQLQKIALKTDFNVILNNFIFYKYKSFKAKESSYRLICDFIDSILLVASNNTSVNDIADYFVNKINKKSKLVYIPESMVRLYTCAISPKRLSYYDDTGGYTSDSTTQDVYESIIFNLQEWDTDVDKNFLMQVDDGGISETKFSGGVIDFESSIEKTVNNIEKFEKFLNKSNKRLSSYMEDYG